MTNLISLELRSTVSADATLVLDLQEVTLTPPKGDELIVSVEAAPVNPSDLGLMLGAADVATARSTGSDANPATTLTIPTDRMDAMRARIGKALSVGNEGAGMVVAAGERARVLVGRKVALRGGPTYARYRKTSVANVVPLPEDVSSEEGAAMFVNPLTALGFVEASRAEGHTAIVQTAAASNLGRMVQRICEADAIPLVNIVRSASQVASLKNAGAKHVLDSTAPGFFDRLTDAVAETGATVAFDALGGGTLGSDILQSMERAANRNLKEYDRYGSNLFKQLYVYGMLDQSPISLRNTAFGWDWSVSGFLLLPFLRKAGPAVEARMLGRVLSELRTTFASHYTATIALTDILRPENLTAMHRKATGQKFLIAPVD